MYFTKFAGTIFFTGPEDRWPGYDPAHDIFHRFLVFWLWEVCLRKCWPFWSQDVYHHFLQKNLWLKKWEEM